jgi:competence protein ComEA
VVLLLILTMGYLFFRGGDPGRDEGKAAESFLGRAKGEIVAALRGDEDGEGVYSLPAGATVRDLLRAAGREIPPVAGAGELDRRLKNGERVTILPPGKGAPAFAVDEIPAAQKMVLGVPVDLNRASLEDLERLPGIGRKTAEAIVRYRETEGPLKSLEDLKKTGLAGDRRIDEIRRFGFAGEGKDPAGGNE